MDRRQFQKVFFEYLKGPLCNLLDMESEAAASYSMSQNPIQDPFRARAKHFGLQIASLLINEKGELDKQVLQELVQLLSQKSFILGPGRVGDVLIFSHITSCLKQLLEQDAIWSAIKRFSIPLCHKRAEEIVKETLWPEPIRILQTVHVRKAVVAAWLTLLRQSTGSCFATAPAMLVQQKEPLKFFKDMYDLLSIGQMKRVFGGKEYSVPLSFSSGSGDLQKGVTGPFFGLSLALKAVSVSLSQEKLSDWLLQPVEKVLRALLLEDAGLTEEDLRDEEHLASLQFTPLLARQGVVFHQRTSERAQRVADWKRRFEIACKTFKAVTECALLRAWEYSLASFADVKIEFARWNLYIGLGLHPEQKNGVGSFLYGLVNDQLQKCHFEIERLAKEYEMEAGAIRAIEVMIQGAVNEMRLAQLKADWVSHTASINTIVEMRNRMIARAEQLTGLFSWLIEKYDEKFQEYFQELFDPEIAHEGPLYEDSPAGFRLVYKHGRTAASQWSVIRKEEEYVEALRDFFSQMENELEAPSIGKELILEMTTSLIQFIRSDEFLKGAFLRAKEKGRLSPWHYISGGTLQTLLMAYCNRDRPFSEKKIIPHSEEELLRFFMTFEKKGPYLCHSPTHAFLFYPERMHPSLKPFRSQKWTEPMREHIAHLLTDRLPEKEKAYTLHLIRQKTVPESNLQFRSQLIEALAPRIKNREAFVDAVLYENVFLLDATQAKKALCQILGMPAIELEGTFFGPLDLYEIAKGIMIQSKKGVFFSENWDQKIAEEMRKKNLLIDVSLFADSNWSDWFFGFLYHPVTGRLELWCLNQTGTQGFPVTDWKEWMHPQNTSSWVVLFNRDEYRN